MKGSGDLTVYFWWIIVLLLLWHTSDRRGHRELAGERREESFFFFFFFFFFFCFCGAQRFLFCWFCFAGWFSFFYFRLPQKHAKCLFVPNWLIFFCVCVESHRKKRKKKRQTEKENTEILSDVSAQFFRYGKLLEPSPCQTLPKFLGFNHIRFFACFFFCFFLCMCSFSLNIVL